ncbi:MAG: 1-deoxy-D-xylulose-5-phosphate synthase [Spirochaetales bacterium]|nr:1-deoxy-D-xylulose-5-phosphate synthase [Spirochaetales bacterium]
MKKSVFEQYHVLKNIQSPKDIKRLSRSQLYTLAHELREYIIKVVSENGGHLASNLGVIELTLALHYVFNSPQDKIVWDVGHQSYAHKIITGRKEAFSSLRKFKGISGFPKRAESKHDPFNTGHSSTSISAALGLAVGRELKQKHGKVIAVIGDGALTGGMALEALNHAGHLGKDLIIILNDNNMSIGQNVGALSVSLTELTTTRYYQLFRKTFDGMVRRIPLFGKRLLGYIYRLKRSIKAFLFRANIFADFGFEYVGPVHGHNINLLINMLKNIKNLGKPVVLHITTQKGRGYKFAETDPTLFHGVGAFSIIDGKFEKKETVSFTEAFGQAITALAEKNKNIVAISAAMTHGTGLSAFEKRFPGRFFDVGICEQHAVTFAAGLACQGLKPVVAIYSTFMQRAADQVIHDVAMQNLPVILCLDRAGLAGSDGETHHGVFDIALFRSVPNLTLLAPASMHELFLMLQYALKQRNPVMIRYPRAVCSSELPAFSQKLEQGRGVFVHGQRSKILLAAVGGIMEQALETAYMLNSQGIPVDVYNLRFIKPLDLDYFAEMVKDYSYICFLEDGVIDGGIGRQLTAALRSRSKDLVFDVFGVPDAFIEQGTREELLALCGLDAVSLARKIKKRILPHGHFGVVKEFTSEKAATYGDDEIYGK